VYAKEVYESVSELEGSLDGRNGVVEACNLIPLAKNPVRSRRENSSVLWRSIICIVCLVLCIETGPRGIRVESYRREVASFGVRLILIMIEEFIVLGCHNLDFPVNNSSSMPAARNRIFTLVAEFLALQAICQCPR
jgi:hypothetical protein